MKFKINRFICIFFGAQLIVWLCWSFVELSITKPIIETFKTTESRGFYLMFMFCVLFMGIPHYLPLENEK